MNMPNRDLGPQDVALCVMPFFHVGGTAAYQFAVFKAGATSVVLEKFDELDVLRTMEKEKVTYVCMVPAMIIRLMDHPDLKKYDLSSLEDNRFYRCADACGGPERGALPILAATIIHQELGQTETLNLTQVQRRMNTNLTAHQRILRGLNPQESRP